jgi:hypothetical protein
MILFGVSVSKRNYFRPSGKWGITANVLQLPKGGDFEALRCQPSSNFDRSTKLDLTTEPPLLGRCCYAFAFLSLFKVFRHTTNVLSTMYAT